MGGGSVRCGSLPLVRSDALPLLSQPGPPVSRHVSLVKFGRAFSACLVPHAPPAWPAPRAELPAAPPTATRATLVGAGVVSDGGSAATSTSPARAARP